MQKSVARRVALASITIFAGLIAATAVADEVDGVANYAYSVFIGTGVYKIDDRTIYILRVPAAFDLREPDYETGKIGLRLLIPFSVGVTNYDSIDDIPDLSVNDLQSVTITPGIEGQIPFRRNWLLKPFVQAGLGWDMKSSANSIVWGAGSRARGWYGDNEKWIIGGEFLYANNNPKREDDPQTSFFRVGLGAEYKYQSKWLVFGRQLSWHGRLLHYEFSNAVNLNPPIEEIRIERSTEVGISFGLNPPINLLGYKFRQGGIGYERAGDVKAIKFFTTFPF